MSRNLPDPRPYCRATNRRSSIQIADGFSLLEMMVVIAIISTLAALLTPAISSLGAGHNLQSAAADVSGTLEQARAYAMAHNTYVWVAFDNNGGDQTKMSVTASKSGSADFTSANQLPIARTRSLKNIVLNDTLPLYGERVEAPFKVTGSENENVLRFNSLGEVRIEGDSNPYTWIEVGLAPPSSNPDTAPPNSAAIQLSGLTGKILIYRP